MRPKRWKQSQPTLTSLHLPFDLVEEILCRLSVKHLTQLRCVCKSWNTLISQDSNFAMKHLRLSTSNQERHHLIRIPNQYEYLKKFVVCQHPISSIFSSASTSPVKQFTYSLGEILNEKVYGKGTSTCDGIICFKLHESLAVLCNPSITKFKILPSLKFPGQLVTLYTLVYHRFTNNYKVIAVNWRRSIKIEVNVHTLGTDYWTRIKDFPHPDLKSMPRPGIFVSNSINWLVYAAAPFIVSLDLEKESYQKLALPVLHDINFFLTLGTLRGCLSLLFNNRDEFGDVWIMKEYGNEKSWTKLLSVPHMKECHFYGYTKALYISEDDKVLMECTNMGINSLVVYDSINNTFKIPKFQYGNKGNMTSEVYVESLISPW